MKLENIYAVSQLVKDRSDVVSKLHSVRNPNTSYFNVHFHGTAQPMEVAEAAAAGLVPFFEARLAELDRQLTALGVEVDSEA